MALSLGLHFSGSELPPPRSYRVASGNRYLHGLEGGEVRGAFNYHLITIDDHTGAFSCQGDYGTFAYRWSVRGGLDGEPLHSFLYDLDFDYFMTKAYSGDHRIVDTERTVKELFAMLLRQRHEDGHWSGAFLNKARARTMYDDLTRWQHDYEGDRLIGRLFDDPDWAEFLDHSDPSYTMDRPGLRRFWDETWKPFREQFLRPHWLAHQGKRPLPRYRALVPA